MSMVKSQMNQPEDQHQKDDQQLTDEQLDQSAGGALADSTDVMRNFHVINEIPDIPLEPK